MATVSAKQLAVAQAVGLVAPLSLGVLVPALLGWTTAAPWLLWAATVGGLASFLATLWAWWGPPRGSARARSPSE
ncbi:MAG TPA: hypothetical protein VKD66_00020 [Streptosporangiaceae bacterium]|nr:hypothetical protein [Streptosporangiaceae bacterium]